MKIYSAVVILFFIATFAHAEEDWLSKCGSYADMGEIMMKARQSGVSMKKIMELREAKGFEKFVIAAFEIPRYNSLEMQKKSIEEFRDLLYLECVKKSKPKLYKVRPAP